MAASFAHTMTLSLGLTLLLLVCSYEAAVPAERFMYSMGLGKRVYKPYSFGLGKRAGDRHRFAFGLGKRNMDELYNEPADLDERMVVDEDPEYFMEEEKRAMRPSAYSFGIGKRAKPQQDRSYYSFGLGKRDVVLAENQNPLAETSVPQASPAEKGTSIAFHTVYIPRPFV